MQLCSELLRKCNLRKVPWNVRTFVPNRLEKVLDGTESGINFSFSWWFETW